MNKTEKLIAQLKAGDELQAIQHAVEIKTARYAGFIVGLRTGAIISGIITVLLAHWLGWLAVK